MAVEWSEATRPVLDLAQRIIAEHHPKLADARFIFVMRSPAPTSNGAVTYGKAKKISAELQLHLDADFWVWLGKYEWLTLTATQREALMDHILCSCHWDGLTAGMRDVDAKIYVSNIRRYGLWWPHASLVEEAILHAIQQPLPLTPSPDEPKREGSVGTIDFGRIAREVAEGLREQGVDTEYYPAGSREE